MDPKLRELFWHVHGEDPYNLPYLGALWNHNDCEKILRFLKLKGLVGQSLSGFIREKCKGSPIHFIGKITKAIAKTNAPPPLLLGVNFK